VVSVLATGPKGRGFKLGRGDVILATKIRSTPFFGWEVKPEVPCRKILRHVKVLLKSLEDYNSHLFRPSLSVVEASLVTAIALWLSS
jgi:hypothetical protein